MATVFFFYFTENSKFSSVFPNDTFGNVFEEIRHKKVQQQYFIQYKECDSAIRDILLCCSVKLITPPTQYSCLFYKVPERRYPFFGYQLKKRY